MTPSLDYPAEGKWYPLAGRDARPRWEYRMLVEPLNEHVTLIQIACGWQSGKWRIVESRFVSPQEASAELAAMELEPSRQDLDEEVEST